MALLMPAAASRSQPAANRHVSGDRHLRAVGVGPQQSACPAEIHEETPGMTLALASQLCLPFVLRTANTLWWISLFMQLCLAHAIDAIACAALPQQLAGSCALSKHAAVQDFGKVLNMGFATMLVLYSLVAGCGYYYWGNKAHTLLTTDLKLDSPFSGRSILLPGLTVDRLVSACILVNACTTYPNLVMVIQVRIFSSPNDVHHIVCTQASCLCRDVPFVSDSGKSFLHQ